MSAACSRCRGGPSIYSRVYRWPTLTSPATKRESFCADCFAREVESRALRPVRVWRARTGGRPRVVVGVSGGKDSSVLLHLLARGSSRLDFDLFPVLVDEGISGYREEGLAAARELCDRVGLPLTVVTFPDEYGAPLDGLVAARPRAGREWAACDVCTQLRGRLLHRTAERLGAGAVATGINLDDRAGNFLFFAASAQAALVFRRGLDSVSAEGRLEQLRPLLTLTEKEVTVYALLQGLPFRTRSECPYAGENVVDAAKRALVTLEKELPGFRYAFVQSLARLGERLPAPAEVAVCPGCGAPRSPRPGVLCAGCRLLENLLGPAARPATGSGRP